MAQSRVHLPAPAIAVAGWLFPGLGYWLIGQRVRAVTVGTTIIAVFVLGILFAGVRVVEAPDMSRPGVTGVLRDKPWFFVQVLIGPIALGTAYASKVVAGIPQYADVQSKARLAEIGTLYTAVAGMLNLLVIIGSTGRAIQPESSGDA